LPEMIARAQQDLLGLDLSANKDLLLIVSILLIVVGLFLAFSGRRIWKRVMSLIGAIIGGLIGFAIGTAVGGVLMGFVVGILASMVGSALFVFLARVGIGVVSGVLGFFVVNILFADEMVALIAGVVAFALTFAFIEVAIGVVTAVVGGLLVGFGLVLMEQDMMVVVLSLLGVIVLGAAFQMIALRDESERKRRMNRVGTRSAVAAAAVAPPEPPPMPGRTCTRCGGPLRYIPEYDRYFCYRCQQYE
jgi:MFS family permease